MQVIKWPIPRGLNLHDDDVTMWSKPSKDRAFTRGVKRALTHTLMHTCSLIPSLIRIIFYSLWSKTFFISKWAEIILIGVVLMMEQPFPVYFPGMYSLLRCPFWIVRKWKGGEKGDLLAVPVSIDFKLGKMELPIRQTFPVLSFSLHTFLLLGTAERAFFFYLYFSGRISLSLYFCWCVTDGHHHQHGHQFPLIQWDLWPCPGSNYTGQWFVTAATIESRHVSKGGSPTGRNNSFSTHD